MNNTDCPTAREFQQLVAGEVSDRRLHSLTQHLERCDRCLGIVDELAKQDEFVRVIQNARVHACDDPIVRSVLAEWNAGHDVANLNTHETETINARLDETSNDRANNESFPFLTRPELPDEIGRLGKYRVFSVLGRGGMGVVFRAEDIHLERQVALKVLWSGNQVPAAMKLRFAREAKTLAAISHDHVVAVHSVEEVDNTPFLTMPLLEGETLANHLADHGALNQTAVAEMGEQVATALSAAHAKGIIHRDLKPSNIWVELDGRIKLIDFGLALYDDLDLTTSGQLMGTPKYMSPEQVKGEAATVESDLFSLGVVLYELAVGRPPFVGANLTSVARAIVDDDRVPIVDANPGVDKELAALIEKLLRADPSERFPDAETVALELRGLRQQLSASPTEPTQSQEEPELYKEPGGKRHLQHWIAGFTLAAVILASLSIIIDFGDGYRVEVTFGDDTEAVQVDVRKQSVVIVDPTDGKPVRITVDKVNKRLLFEKDGFSIASRRFDLSTTSGRTLRVQFDTPANNSTQTEASKVTLSLQQLNIQKDAMRWVFQQGGHVILTDYQAIHEIAQVPDEPSLFETIAVNLQNSKSLTDDDLKTLANARIGAIYLHGPLRGQCLKWLTEIETLEGIQLIDCHNLDSKNFKYLFGNERIEYLSADHSAVGDELTRAAASLPNLRTLVLGANATDESTEILSSCSSLVDLTVAHSPTLTAKGLLEVDRIPHLRVLRAKGSQIDREVVSEINRHGSLKVLSLESPLPNAEVLCQLVRIESLDLSYSDVSEFELLRLSKIPSLVELHLPADVDARERQMLDEQMPDCRITTQ